MIKTRTRDADNASAKGRRILIYSHDTFGLGHLRRSRAIANALVAADPDTRVLVVSGSAMIDRFAFADGVAPVRIPGVIKRPDDTYASLDGQTPLDRTVAERARIIARSAATFRPHLMIVDKEPTGFQGEMLPALEMACAQGCRIVLGIRDVLDEAERLVPEWERKGASAAVRRYYDELWVYGVPRIHEPLAALPIAAEVADRLIYTGYLRREAPEPLPDRREPAMARTPFVLVTPGGGGDGDSLIDWVISAYEVDPGIPLPALVAFGPFMSAKSRAGFLDRIEMLPTKLAAITFDTEIELLMKKADGLVAMGGYNTFCEILSFDKRAILVPRTQPRREQRIRAVAADALGLARCLLDEEGRDPNRMAAALRALPRQALPSRSVGWGLLDGLDAVTARVRALTASPRVEASAVPRRCVSA